MKTNIKGILLTEVNRMREIMGMNIINEQKVFGVIKNLLGVSDEGVELIAKGNTEDLGQYSSSLKTKVGGTGTGSISDITNFLSKKGIGTSEAEIASWIKSQPDIMGQIARNSEDIMKQASQIVFNKLKLTNIFDQKSIDAINNTLKLSLDDEFSADSIIIRVDGAISSLRKVLAEKGVKNAEVEDLIKKLEDKKKIAQNYKSSMNATPVNKSVDNVMGESRTRMLSLLDGVADGDEKSFFIDVISKASDDEIKQVDEIVSKIPKGKEEEFVETIKNKMCSVKESNGSGFRNGCDNVSAFIRVFDKSGKPWKAGLGLLLLSIVLFGGIPLAIVIIKGLQKLSKGDVPNPFDTDKEGGSDETADHI